MVYKIYKITDNTNDNVYFGSTKKSLAERRAKHKYHYKKYLEGKFKYITSFIIIKNDDYIFEIVEEVKNKEDLKIRERYYIDNNKCVNKNIPSRSLKESKKNYYDNNKEKILKQKKEYYLNNRTKKLQYQIYKYKMRKYEKIINDIEIYLRENKKIIKYNEYK